MQNLKSKIIKLHQLKQSLENNPSWQHKPNGIQQISLNSILLQQLYQLQDWVVHLPCFIQCIQNKFKKNQFSLNQNPQKGSRILPNDQDMIIFNNRSRSVNNSIYLSQPDRNLYQQYVEQQNLATILTEQCVLNIFDKCVQLANQEELNKIYNINRKARRAIFSKTLINANVKNNNRRQSFQSVKSLQSNHADFYNAQSGPSPIGTPLHMPVSSLRHRLHSNYTLSYPEALSFSETYYRFVCTFEEEFKYLIDKTQKDFSAFLDIDFNLITQSIDYHISKEDNQNFNDKILQWNSTIRQLLKTKLTKYNQAISSDKICEILNYQIEYLKQKRPKIRQTIHKLGISNDQQLQALPTLLAFILEDTVYQKFKVQQQQMTIDTIQLSKNKELELLMKQFQQLTGEISQEMYEEINKDQIINDQNEYY